MSFVLATLEAEGIGLEMTCESDEDVTDGSLQVPQSPLAINSGSGFLASLKLNLGKTRL